MKEKQIKLPEKTTMNLYQPNNKSKKNLPLILSVVLLALTFIGVTGKFLVFDKLTEMKRYEKEIEIAQLNLDSMYVKLQNYSQVKEDFYRYCDVYVTDNSETLMNRIDILTILEENVGVVGETKSISISGNVVGIKVITKDLSDLALIEKNLKSHENIIDVTVFTASKGNSNKQGVESSITFTLHQEG